VEESDSERERSRTEMEMRDPGDSRERRIKGSVPYHGVEEYSRYKTQKEVLKAPKEEGWSTA